MINNSILLLLNNLRNSNLNFNKFIIVENNNLNYSLLKILKNENYINSFFSFSNKSIKIILIYKGWWKKVALISKIKIINQCQYTNYTNFFNNFKLLKYNQGLLIISTNFGLMSHKEAIKLKLGGKILFYIE